MPIHSGKDAKGKYWKWGHHGKKYYYHSKSGSVRAKSKAQKQAVAIYSTGWRDSMKEVGSGKRKLKRLGG
jgi:hypothetical protein